MKKITLASVLLLVACQTTVPTVDTAFYLQDAQSTTKNFTQQLGSTLKQQIASQGVASAIPVCKEAAPAIALQHSSSTKTVTRISAKARNRQQGIPDAWEAMALQRFAEQTQAQPTQAKPT